MADAPDYKQTVNLPVTDFPMKANLPVREPAILQRWTDEAIYERLIEENAAAGGEPFVFHDGPPYANNHIHQGHMLNKILKDMVVKFRSMEGRVVRFVPGWDCHGLPIELQVDKKLGAKKREMSRSQIRDACRAYAQEWIDVQREEFKRLGVFADWDHPYLSMSFDFEAATVRQLARFAERGSLYRGKKPVYWCINDRTALAEAEVEYAEHTSPSIYVAFDVVAGLDERFAAAAGRRGRVAIWTTTPWTLPANLAVAVHPDFTYVLYRLGDELVLVAKDLLVSFLAAVAPGELKDGELADPTRVVGSAEGKDLEGIRYRHPFLSRESPVILGEHVTLEQGTGLVHTAPGHGQEDYQVGLRYGLEVLNPVDDAGFLTDAAGAALAGQRIWDANPAIVQMLRDSGHLLAASSVQHSYPHCWRCMNPVVFRATDQWFISMETNQLRAKALAEVDRVRWIPKWGRERIHGMLENRPDWCVSRQRTWGTPIPVLYCESCDAALVEPAVMERAAAFIEEEGGNAWYERPASDFVAPGHTCGCGSTVFRKETDILDVWFDSGTSWAAVLEGREQLGVPADLYLEGSDQHRGWFHSSLLCSVGVRDEAPYKAVLTHGFLVDAQGRKISKKLGNYVDPAKLIARYGAELMRLWVASEDYRGDLHTSEALFQQLGDGYFRIRNTLRYCLGNIVDFDPAADAVALADLEGLDAWAMSRLSTFTEKARKAYDDYEFHLVCKAALDFCAELSSLYLDVRKDLLYCNGKGSPERRATQTLLHAVVRDLCRILAPVLSFTAEEAWGFLPGDRADSVFLAGLPEAKVARDPALDLRFERLLAIRSAASRQLELARRDKKIGKSLDARVVLGASGELLDFLRREKDELLAFLIVSQLEVIEGGEGAAAEEVPGLTVAVEPARGEKCVRCWTFSEDLGTDPRHPQLCPRCTAAVGG
ncbi:isoleucine--tRNA ligase [Vulgatibacter incomptus]|uniref:Isoleucine--tRNA ligase n=1 Tax=Vulgatibacter incomptus TaxID=1391653 RepID=A0A0K1PH41_9BACT|nr:isoleucine--tRNA ligase [Vulgatibacter incomptus]AKU92827.1 Isoleucyl-tRNA synthetase [Vulgatibacter incomptus]